MFSTGNDFHDNSGNLTAPNYCASDDGDGTNAVTITQSASNYAALVTDAPAGDFTITNSGSELYHAGTDLSLSTDIIGQEWDASTPSIGAFELIVSGVSIPVFMHHYTKNLA